MHLFAILPINSKKNVNVQKGTCLLTFQDNGEKKNTTYTLTHFNPTGESDFINKMAEYSQNILFFNSQRSFEYQNLATISRDPDKSLSQTASEAYTGISIQRYMWSAHKDALKPEQLYNLNIGKNCFNVLDSAVCFSRVIPDTNDIMVCTQQGEVYFAFFSSPEM